MANKLQSTGDIKMSQAAAAFNRTNSLSDYYADIIGTDNFVDNPAVDEESFGQHPNSGSPISLGDLYGDANVDRFVISSNQVELNLRTYLMDQGWDQTSRAFVTINPGVFIISNTSRVTIASLEFQTPALLISGDWPNGLFITNNGNILGHGGDGAGRTTTSLYNAPQSARLWSSSWDGNHIHSMLNSTTGTGGLSFGAGGNATIAAGNTNYSEYLQMDLGQNTSVHGVVTQGRAKSHNQYVTRYRVKYSTNENPGNFLDVDNGAQFTGNSDMNTAVTRTFATTVTARYVRIYPTAFYGHASIRAAVVTFVSASTSSLSPAIKGSAAIKITSPTLVNIENNGVIAGGGGGGAASNTTGGSAKSGGGGGAGGGKGGNGVANSGNKTHNGVGGAGATTIGQKGSNGSAASSDVQGKGGDAGGSGGGYKNST